MSAVKKLVMATDMNSTTLIPVRSLPYLQLEITPSNVSDNVSRNAFKSITNTQTTAPPPMREVKRIKLK